MRVDVGGLLEQNDLQLTAREEMENALKSVHNLKSLRDSSQSLQVRA